MTNWEKIWKDADVDTPVHVLLERTRACRGTALDVCDETLSYSEFHKRSDLFAAWMQAQGYGADAEGTKSVVIISMRAGADLFCMIAAAVKAGVVATVTEDDVPPARLRKLYEQTKAIARITDDQIPRICAEGSRLRLKKIADRMRPDDVYAIWYTSGTTGEPCGILTLSYNLVCNIAPVPGNEIMSDCLKESSALLNISHPSFGLGFTNFFYAVFYGKKFVHVQSGREDSIQKIARKMRDNKGCFLLFTPSGVSACLQDAEAKRNFKYCSAVMMGADVVKSSLIGEVSEAMGTGGKVINLYGISDVGLVAAKIAGKDDKPHAVGKPTACTRIYAVDEDRNPLPTGEPGEFCVSGIRVGPGYIGAAPEKRNKFVHGDDGVNRFFTGDYGYVDEEGEIYLLGRTDRLIKHMGYRVDALEVEEAIRREAHVGAVAVKQFTTERGGILCAFYESGEALDPGWIRDRIVGVLPRYCIPERFIHLQKLPLTERGKLDDRALTLPEGEDGERGDEAPVNEREKTLCEAFETCLKTEKPVGRRDSFFALGGDSVLGMLLLAYLGESCDLHYTIEELFLHPSPCDLARVAGAVNKETDAVMSAASVPLPKEMVGIRESEATEEILPAEAASSLYLFLQEAASAYERGLYFNLRVRLGRSFSEEAFQRRVWAVTARHPALRSYFLKDSEGKRWQVFKKEASPVLYYRDLSAMSEEARERYLCGFRRVMDENGAAFQAACFPLGDGLCELQLRLTHTVCDGVSAVILVNELAQDEDPVGPDAFYPYRRRRLAARESFPEELKDYYRSFTGGLYLPAADRGTMGRIERRNLTLGAAETEELKRRCGRLGLPLASYVEYCYGKGLLAAMEREDVWFSHLYSGRDGSFLKTEGIVGNLIYTMPVYLTAKMSAKDFQKELMKPWRYPFLTDTGEYRRLNRHNIEEGIISRIFMPYHEKVLSVTDEAKETQTGHYMEFAEGALRIVFRYPEDEKRSLAYQTVIKVMKKTLTKG